LSRFSEKFTLEGKDDAESSDFDFANSWKHVGQLPTTALNGYIENNFYAFEVC